MNGSIPLDQIYAVHPAYRNTITGCAWKDRHKPIISGPTYNETNGNIQWTVLVPATPDNGCVIYCDVGLSRPEYRWWCLHYRN